MTSERVYGRHGLPRTVDAVDADAANAVGAASAASVPARPRRRVVKWKAVYNATFWGCFVCMVCSMSLGRVHAGYFFGGLWMLMALLSKLGS